jgi:hypothetical protein
MRRRIGAAVAVLGTALALSCTAATAADGWTVVATHLDNPRGLAFDPSGGSWNGRGGAALYVAEAGRGGTGPCGVAGAGDLNCLGATGAITRITADGQRRVVTGLPSIAPVGGQEATGPHDVALWQGHAYIPIGCGCTLAKRAAFGPFGQSLGTLVRALLPSGSWQPLADFVAYDDTFNPDGFDVNANPYAALALPGHRYVIDAGGNDLFDVQTEARHGPALELKSIFPTRLVPAPPFLGLPPGAMIPMQPVPNSIVRGPDGALYVGELTGFPFPVGGARVYRVDPHSFGPPQVYATGFTNIIDLAFDEHGTLYVLEHRKFSLLSPDTTGALIRVNSDGTHTEIASTGLVNPTGLAIRDGSAFVSNYGTSPGIGEVVAIRLH